MELDCLLDKMNSEELKKQNKTKKTREHKQNDNINPPENDPLISCAHPFGYTNTGEKKNSWWKKRRGQVPCDHAPSLLNNLLPALEKSHFSFSRGQFFLLSESDFSLHLCAPPPHLPSPLSVNPPPPPCGRYTSLVMLIRMLLKHLPMASNSGSQKVCTQME